MTGNLSGVGNRTNLAFKDFSKPPIMEEGERMFKKLQLVNGKSGAETLITLQEIANIVKETRGSEIDQMVTKIEKKLYNRKSLGLKGEDAVDNAGAVLGMVYAAINEIDKGDSIANLQAAKSTFEEMFGVYNSRVLTKLENQDQTRIVRALDTLSSRIDRIVKRFNKRVEKFEIQGPQIQSTF